MSVNNVFGHPEGIKRSEYMSVQLVQQFLRSYECKHVACDCGTTLHALAGLLAQPQSEWPTLVRLGAEKLHDAVIPKK